MILSRHLRSILPLLALTHPFAASFGSSNIVQTPEGTVQLLVQEPLDSTDRPARWGFYFELKPGWHVYWKNPGDSGLPPTVEWLNGTGSVEFSEFEWPVPKRIKLNVL